MVTKPSLEPLAGKPTNALPLRTAALPKGQANLFGGLKLKSEEGAEPIPNQIREALKERHVRAIDLFRQIDIDGSGHITCAEFVKALEEFGLRAPYETTSAVFAAMDVNKSGSIEYAELEKMLNKSFTKKPKLEPLDVKSHNQLVLRTGKVKRQDVNLFKGFILEAGPNAESIPTQIRNALNDRKARVIDLFHQIDDDQSGTIDATEFVRAMGEFGLKDVPANHLSAVFNALDLDGSGALNVKELEKIMRASVSAAASIAPLTTKQHNAAMLKAKDGTSAMITPKGVTKPPAAKPLPKSSPSKR